MLVKKKAMQYDWERLSEEVKPLWHVAIGLHADTALCGWSPPDSVEREIDTVLYKGDNDDTCVVCLDLVESLSPWQRGRVV